jgi:hypothetical protein
VGKYRNKARRWIGRAAWALIFAGLLLVYEGIFLDFASQLGNVATSTQRSLGMSYSPSPVREMRWIGVDEVRPDGPAALAGLQAGDGVKFDVFLEKISSGNRVKRLRLQSIAMKRFRAKLTAQKPPPRSPQKNRPVLSGCCWRLNRCWPGSLHSCCFAGCAIAPPPCWVSMTSGSIRLAFVPHWAFVALVLFVALPFKAVSLIVGRSSRWRSPRGRPACGGSTDTLRAAAVLAVAFLVSQLVGILRVPLPFPVPVLFIVTYLADLALGLAIIVRNYGSTIRLGATASRSCSLRLAACFLGSSLHSR